MKIKEGFILRHIGDEIIVVAVGEASKDFNGIIRMNSTGEFLWNAMSSETNEDALVSALLSEYEIDEATARRDASAFIEKLNGAGILE